MEGRQAFMIIVGIRCEHSEQEDEQGEEEEEDQ